MKRSVDILLFIVLLVILALLFWFNLSSGSVKITADQILHILSGGLVENDSYSYIVENRLNRSVVAIGAGGALAVSGLILQVFFRNPLAGPGVLGISSGASLGVAFVLLGGLGFGSFLGQFGIISAGIIGALGVLLLLLFLSRFIENAVTLLVVGLMFGYFTSAIINILFLWADPHETREFVVWGLGSFDGFSTSDMWTFMGLIGFFSLSSLSLIKPLNAMVLGDEQAKALGVNIRLSRLMIILVTGILAAVVTVYCGPISFIGIAVPQIIRLIVRSKNHFILIPIAFLFGSVLALLADFIVRWTDNSLPLNTATAIIGTPVIIWTIVKINKHYVKF